MGDTKRQRRHLGIVGLGGIGRGLVERLHEKYTLHVYDPNLPRRDEIAYQRAEACETPADVAEASDIVLLNLPDAAETVACINKELKPGLKKGAVLMLLTPCDLVDVKKLAKELAAQGAGLVDAPLSGSEARVREGNLCIFVGAAAEDYKRVGSLLKLLGGSGKVMHCGSPGAGQIVKAVETLALGLGHAAVLEALAFGANFGATPQQLWRALRASPVLELSFAQNMDTVLGSGPDALSVKPHDLPAIARAARLNKRPLPLTEALLQKLASGEPKIVERGKLCASFWNELTKKHGTAAVADAPQAAECPLSDIEG